MSEWNLLGLDNVKSKFFVRLPIDIQIQALFNENGFVSLTQERFKRQKTNESNLMTCMMEKCTSLSENGGPLSSNNPFNISFIFNTDEIPVFKSSKMSV